MRALEDDLDGALESGGIDLALAPKRRGSAAIVWSELFADRFVTLVREGHPRIRRRLTLDRFCAERHVVVAPEGRLSASAVDRLLATLGRERRVALRVPSFLVAPLVVAGSDAIATMPEGLARQLAASLRLRVLPTPLELPPLRIAMAWHERLRRDAGHAWLRQRIATVAKARRTARGDRLRE